jgi:hypothetical protein
MSLADSIRQALPFFVDHAASDTRALRLALQQAGHPVEFAAELVEFMPLAFGRLLLEGTGVQLSDVYSRLDREGCEKVQARLIDEPVYRQALAIAREVASQDQVAFMAVAGRSSELNAVSKALYAGSKPESLLVSPPVLFGASPLHH